METCLHICRMYIFSMHMLSANVGNYVTPASQAISRMSSWSVSGSILWGSGLGDSDRVCQNAPKPYLE